MLNKIKNQLLITVILATMFAALVGCSEPAEKMVEDSETEVISEELVEVTTNSEVSEPVFEEPSEVVSEEVSEIVDGVQMVYYETYEDFLTFFENLQEPVIAVFHFTEHVEEGQAILYDGARYILSENFIVTVKTPEIISSMESSNKYVYISDYDYKGSHEWDITLETTGTDIEVPLTITYEDGTTDTLTVYITKDWKYSWES